MSHRIVAIIECDHVSPEGVACTIRKVVWKTAVYESHSAQARVARRVMADDKSGWQLGVVGTFNGVPSQTLDFCPEHHVETEQAYDGGRARYDLDKIPMRKKDT